MNILHIACESANNINIIRFIVSLNKINLNDKSDNGNTPLLYLCDIRESRNENYLFSSKCNNYKSSGDYMQIVKYFSSLKDVDLTFINEEGQNVIHILCKNKNLQLVEHFVSFDKIDLNAKDKKGQNPLNIACECGNLDLVKFLVSLDKIDLTEVDNEGKTIMHALIKIMDFLFLSFSFHSTRSILDLKIKKKREFCFMHVNVEISICFDFFKNHTNLITMIKIQKAKRFFIMRVVQITLISFSLSFH